MTAGIAVTIRCGDETTTLYDTVRSVLSQSRPAGAVIVVADRATPKSARPWIAAMSARHGVEYIDIDGASADAYAAGHRASTLPYTCALDAGDRLAPNALARMAAVLDDEDAVDIVTAASLLLGPGDRREVLPPLAVTPDQALAASPAMAGAMLLRRAAVDAVGGIDAAAGDLHWYELHLRMLLEGRQARQVPEPLLVRAWRRDAMYARAWGSSERLDALGHVIARHADAIAADPGAVLYAREAELLSLAARYRTLLSRHRDDLEEIETFARETSDADATPVDFGDLRRVAPVARDWGYSRGVPLDRHYIEQFIGRHAGDIAGRVLEIQEDDYARNFGGARVSDVDVLDLSATNPRATVLADLRCAANVADGSYDCIILTQTAHLVDEAGMVIAECGRLLRPGGVLLVTFPSVSRVCVEYGEGGDHWRLTPAGVRRLCETAFAPGAIEIETMGNVLATTAFLHGLAGHELSDAELAVVDPYFPLVVGARAIKAGSRATSHSTTGGSAPVTRHVPEHAVLLYHRIATPASDAHGLAISPAAFEAHVAHLRAHAHVLPLAQFVEGWLGGTLPQGAVAITFDDGYADVLEHAAPILRTAELPATCFATTDRLDQPYEFWWDVLEAAMLDGPVGGDGRLEVVLGGEVLRFDASTADARAVTHRHLYDALVGLPADERDKTVATISAWSALDRSAVPRRMDGAALTRWAAMPGLEIGAHTVHHTMLPRQSPDVQRAEIAGSKRVLEQRLGLRVSAFAYPFGAADDASADAVRAAGFRCGFICGTPAGADPAPDRWRLPRLEITPAVAARFADLVPRAWR